MKWDEGHESPDVIDRRGEGGGGRGLGGLLGIVPMLLRMRGGWLIALVLVGVVVVVVEAVVVVVVVAVLPNPAK